ncbi:cupin domain-containing protein [Salipaludibacillus sp. HK11]|uniref:cupin domain-containing protein n=1 Tax=Salipaludibacillus sp. HK11 TaxID=3394320 RepID=UPI0039FCFF44
MYNYVPNPYLHPYYTNANAQVNNSEYMSRSQQDYEQQESEVILTGIKRVASSIELYQRLAKVAPTEKHKNDILHALKNKKEHLYQFTNLYSSLTGRQPAYHVNNMSFDSYLEGLQIAQDKGVESSEEFRKSALITKYREIQHAFLRASSGERANMTQLRSLNDDAIKDYGSAPFVVNMEKVTKQNDTFRTALWTGKHLQLTLMSIGVGEDIGLEVHPHLDQFLRLEQGEGLVQMGDSEFNLDFEDNVFTDYAIFVPAGKWHNLTNTGNETIKLYSIYAPPEHPFGTVHETKAIAIETE